MVAKRKATPAQLRALAKGRAKLKASRRGETSTRKTNPTKSCRFTFKPQAELGIRSNKANVYCGRKLIGYIELKNVPAMKKGIYTGFAPINNWRNTFSQKLKERLGLSVPRKRNPGPPTRGAIMSTDLPSLTRATTRRRSTQQKVARKTLARYPQTSTRQQGYTNNPPHYVIKGGKGYFDGAGWSTTKKGAAQYLSKQKAATIGQKIANTTNKQVSVVAV